MDPVAAEATPADPIPRFQVDDLRDAALRDLEAPGTPSSLRAPEATKGRPLTVKMQAQRQEPDWMRQTQSDLDELERGAHRLHVGMAIGDYVVVHFIASGGFAEVYKVRHHKTGETRALKILSALHAVRKDSVERLINEGKTLLRLREIANVVYVFEMFETVRQGMCIVMELLDDGESLAAMLAREQRLRLEVALEIVIKVAQTLATVHNENVVHRDLSPGNVYVRRRVKEGVTTYFPTVLDLGCAKTEDGPHTSSKVATVGTWMYISPEQVGRGAIGPRSDIYSLACILYHLVEGACCFAGHMERTGGTADFVKFGWHIYAEPTVPSWIPVRLWNDAVAPNLEKDPAQRHPDMVTFARALHRFARDLKEGKLSPADRTMTVDAATARRPPQPLPPLQQKSSALPDVEPEEIALSLDCPSPSLLVTDGPYELIGKRYRIGRRVVIGRTLPDARPYEGGCLEFEVGNISGRHVELDAILEGQAEAVYSVTDLGGLNGTELNGVVAATGVLCPPGVIRLAGFLEFELVAPGSLSLSRARRPFDKRLQREREALARTMPQPQPALRMADEPKAAETLIDREKSAPLAPKPTGTPRWMFTLLLLFAGALVVLLVVVVLLQLHVIGGAR